MTTKIVRASEHFHHEEGDWLSTYWHFSFDFYRDPQNMGFGPLRVFNDDVIKPGKGFGFHPHRDMEIITYVIDGELEHRDDKGNHGVIYAGEIQRMTAGTGIVHSEYNHSKEKPLRLLQMWVQANKRGLAPSWEQQKFSTDERKDRLLPVVVAEGTNNASSKRAVHMHQDASMYVSSLGAGKQVEHALAQDRKAYVFVIDGDATVNGQKMQKQDAARIEDENKVSIRAGKPAEIILVDLPGRYDVNK
ncbi:Pirin-related protein [Candidatus Nitrososphaera evergladensis SR1]|uniref:Pirin-related protein n=1 Tax=Candidatus Nitrososphaera evergladensis SR1 TaxID=1459636 RepID=A0A075MXM1_9ARCH|nr:pirin family protein [Candidatus Nitrososphaera evergladensis]AIF85357.1 Pirin-related protein [Candidatus Nitrososphaera evergladensis SR1]